MEIISKSYLSLSLMLATGKLTLEELSLEMGHGSISTTLKWYIHQVKNRNYGDFNPIFSEESKTNE